LRRAINIIQRRAHGQISETASVIVTGRQCADSAATTRTLQAGSVATPQFIPNGVIRGDPDVSPTIKHGYGAGISGATAIRFFAGETDGQIVKTVIVKVTANQIGAKTTLPFNPTVVADITVLMPQFVTLNG
jgi:hypothetical protein